MRNSPLDGINHLLADGGDRLHAELPVAVGEQVLSPHAENGGGAPQWGGAPRGRLDDAAAARPLAARRSRGVESAESSRCRDFRRGGAIMCGKRELQVGWVVWVSSNTAGEADPEEGAAVEAPLGVPTPPSLVPRRGEKKGRGACSSSKCHASAAE